jgi:hypothetical protein
VVVYVRLARVLVIEVLVGMMGVPERSVIVLVRVARAQVIEPARRRVVIVRDMEVLVRVCQLLVVVLFPAIWRIPVPSHYLLL